jgi:ribosomal protein L11 methylase PrmA
LIIPFREIDPSERLDEQCYRVLEPEMVHFISYPYEWCFSQLKDAALTTLEIQMAALRHGMTLKDASAYNIQFHRGRPVLIDLLSFERYKDGKPWEAYRQFCQHFLAPLALMSYTDIRLNTLLKTYLDGVPLDLAGKLLPFHTKLNFSLLMHIHMHARAQKKYEHGGASVNTIKIPKSNLLAMIRGLQSTVRGLRQKTRMTEWSDYYTFTNYSGAAFAHKKEIIAEYMARVKPVHLWDLGANRGDFTTVAAQGGTGCIAFDIDPLAAEYHYLSIKKTGVQNILPLVMDLTNPSPGIGWNNEERSRFAGRTKPDTVMALALVHHLAVSNNLPLSRIASFLRDLGDNLIIEFIPKTDSQVKILLRSRKDIFENYSEEQFVKEFKVYFNILETVKIRDSERTLFLMKRKPNQNLT